MSIILNEYAWAQAAIDNRTLGKKPYETLNRVSKYYLRNSGSKKEVRNRLEEFLVACDPSVPVAKWSDKLDRIAKDSDKFPLVMLDAVDISENELKRIELLGSRQTRRLAFTLLCAAKYWDILSSQNNHWVNTSDREIMQMANINTSVKRQSLMFSELRDAGYIRFSKRIDNLNVQVIFMEEGKPAIQIKDFRNLGYQYLKHCGEPYFECQHCGIMVKIPEPNKGRPPKYCPTCSAEIKAKQNIDSVMRRRDAMREQVTK